MGSIEIGSDALQPTKHDIECFGLGRAQALFKNMDG